MMTDRIDEAFLHLSEFLEESANVEGQLIDDKTGFTMVIDQVEMNIPVELDLSVNEDGQVTIGAMPPIYYVETTIFPVYHQITLKLERVESEKHDQ